MSLIQKLGSPDRVLVFLRGILDEADVRALAETYHIGIPGFRPGHGPPALTVRAISQACFDDRALREALEQRLERAAAPAVKDLLAAELTDAEQRIREADRLPRPAAMALILAGLSDPRARASRAALEVADAVARGDMRLVSRPEAVTAARGAAHPARSAGASISPAERPRQRTRETPDRDRVLQDLRDESTRQEQKLQRLRTQLQSEREAHRRTRHALVQLERERSAPAGERTELRAARRESDTLRSQLAQDRLRNENALRDLNLLLDGTRVLEEILVALSRKPAPAPSEPVRPRKPSRTCDLPPESKVALPSESALWPAYLPDFLARVARSEFVARIHVVGVTAGAGTRVVADVPDSSLLVHYSDGRRAARLLLETTAHSPATLLWVRRHVAEEYFPTG